MYKNEEIIEQLGGKKFISEYLGISLSAVYLWFYKKPKGNDAVIPPKQAIKIYLLAKEKGYNYTIEDILGGEVK